MTRRLAIRNMTHQNSDTTNPLTMPASSDAGLDIEALSPRQLRVVLVCDVVESVRWMEHDEDNAITRWSQFAATVRSRIAPEHAGSVVKSTGDGLMLEFESAPQAVAAANAMQKLSAEGNAGFDAERQLHLRIGIHQAQVRRDAHDLYGHGVNLAARISTLAGPGDIIVTPEVRDHLTDSLDGDIEDMGECYLKHLSEPQRVYRVSVASEQQSSLLTTTKETLNLPCLAVIPFKCLDNGSPHEVLGEVLCGNIIAHLSKSKTIKVLSRLSTTPFKRHTWDAVLNGLSTHAQYIISGTYLVRSNGFQGDFELIDVAKQTILHAGTFSGDASVFFQINDQIATQIVGEILAALFKAESQAVLCSPFPNLASYQLLLGAINLMYQSNRDGFMRSKAMLDHLIERHPRSTAALVWRASWQILNSTRGLASDSKRESGLAINFAERALELDPVNATAMATLAFVNCHLIGDFCVADELLTQAIAIEPNCAVAHLYSTTVKSFLNEPTAAVNAGRVAISLSPYDPMSYYYHCLLFSAYLYDNNVEEALVHGLKSYALNRIYPATLRLLTVAYVEKGDLLLAKQYLQQLRAVEPELTLARYRRRFEKVPVASQRFAKALMAAGLPN